MRLLIAEDDATQRHLLGAILRKAGHDVIEAVDGLDAWQKLEAERLRLVITDWLMPSLTGPELITKVREAGWPTYTYLILLTAREDKGSTVAGLEAGADDYVTKPYDRAELMARLAIGERILDLEARLAEMAARDSLTGLLNRRALYTRAEAELARARRDGTSVAVVLLDVDRFKAVNDTYGHAAGDEVLRKVADALVGSGRPYDHVARWGGEEFLVFLPGATTEGAAIAAERLREALASSGLVRPDGNSLTVTASFGVAGALPAAGPVSLDSLVRVADGALSLAKAAGRDRVVAG